MIVFDQLKWSTYWPYNELHSHDANSEMLKVYKIFSIHRHLLLIPLLLNKHDWQSKLDDEYCWIYAWDMYKSRTTKLCKTRDASHKAYPNPKGLIGIANRWLAVTNQKHIKNLSIGHY